MLCPTRIQHKLVSKPIRRVRSALRDILSRSIRSPRNPVRNGTFVLLSFSFAVATAEQTEPTLATNAELRARRSAIYVELDQNVSNVKQCFEMLDDTAESDQETRQFLDAQIQQFDHRSNALHEELQRIERFEFLANRERELVEQAKRLREEGEQLRKGGHLLPAKLRQAKARKIQRSLDDGTWKILADEQWCGDNTPEPDLISVLQLNIEVENLKQETSQLRQELKDLRKLVEGLERQMRESSAKTR